MRNQGAAQRVAVIVCALDRVNGPKRCDGDFAGRHAGDQRDVDLPVEADRTQHRLDRFADPGGKTVIDRRLGSIGRGGRHRAQKPDHDHHRENRRAGAAEKYLTPLQ